MINDKFNLKRFIIITLITSIWINITEIARAALVAFPRMVAFYGDKVHIIGVDSMTIWNGLIWFGWDMLITAILVFTFWLCAKAFGNNIKSIFISGTMTSLATIGVFWIGSANSGLGTWGTAFILIFLSCIELLIGACIASKLYARKED